MWRGVTWVGVVAAVGAVGAVAAGYQRPTSYCCTYEKGTGALPLPRQWLPVLMQETALLVFPFSPAPLISAG